MSQFRIPDNGATAAPVSDPAARTDIEIEQNPDAGCPTGALLGFDPSDYREHLDSCPITDAQKDELLRALWDIMCAFVDLGWGLDAVSLVLQNTSTATPDGVEAEQPKSESGALRGSNVL